MSDVYLRLQSRLREVATAGSALSILHWDQETMMPPAGAGQRARTIAWMSRLVHEQAICSEIGDLIGAAEQRGPWLADPEEAANLKQIRRNYDRARKLPSELVASISETSSAALEAWKKARAASDWAEFSPWLQKLLVLLREKAEAFGVPEGGELYDALAEEYESGMRADAIEKRFAGLREALIPLIREAAEATRSVDFSAQRALRVSVENQEKICQFAARRVGYDFNAGRLDASTHPFSTSIGVGDTRITTRYRESDLLDGLGSTLHEVGHALYEQGLPKEKRAGEPLGEAAGLGIHESQSRLWENQVGRSTSFWEWLMPHARSLARPALDAMDAEQMARWANRVEPHPIRVESDETTYNLHVMLRFDIERALLKGDLAVQDVPGLWNERMQNDLGLTIEDDAFGCLQDIHWSLGAIGYFPTYTLGNLYAAQFWAAAGRDIPQLDRNISRGEFQPLLDWLRVKIHRHGHRYSADELCMQITGSPMSAEPLIDYLRSKAAHIRS